jgi:hypothetical protein
MEHMGVYLTNSANQTIELPVAPSDFVLTAELDGEKTTVLGLGEVERLGLAKLRDLEVKSTLPLKPQEAPWCTATKLLGSAQDYINWLNAAKNTKKPLRVVLSGTQMNMSATLLSFKYGFESGSSIEYQYTLTLTEYREIKALKTVIKPTKPVVPVKPAPRPAPPKKIGVGSVVIVNGQLHVNSWGAGPGQTERNATRRINFTAPGRACPYHVTLLNGGWRGWVTAGSVRAQ